MNDIQVGPVRVTAEHGSPSANGSAAPGKAEQPGSERRDARTESPGRIVYLFAGLYFTVISLGWLVMGKVESAEYFTQAALVLASIGLYHAPPPGPPRR